MICGTAFKNKGVQTMLDAVVDYLPSPLDVPPIEGLDVDDPEKTLVRHASDSEPFAALVFKIMTDPYVGQLAFFRVYSGTLKSGDSVYNVAKGRKERIGRLLRMHANKREEIQEILAGDICAAVGLKTVSTGDTICDDEHPIVLESIDFPMPVIQLAVEPKTKADQEKLGMAIQKLAQEDPTFRVATDPETGQTILSGMGELHLEIIVDRMMREFGVGANVGKPQVAYRETIRKSERRRRAPHQAIRRSRPVRRGEDSHRAIAGRRLRIRERDYRRARAEGIHRTDRGRRQGSARGRHPGRLPDVGHQGDALRRQLSRCGLVGNGVQDRRFAGHQGSRAKRAKPVLLEPIMAVEVVVPEEYMGDVIGDLNSRRGRIEGMELRGTTQIIKVMVPLSEMFGYATELRSRTQGRGSFTMHFGKYEEVPGALAEEIVSKVQGKISN